MTFRKVLAWVGVGAFITMMTARFINHFETKNYLSKTPPPEDKVNMIISQEEVEVPTTPLDIEKGTKTNKLSNSR